MEKSLLPAALPPVNLLYNGLLFNISWFVIVLGQSAVVGLAAVAVHLGIHFRLMGKGAAEWQLVGLVALVGLAIDQVLFALGVFVIDGARSHAPLWLSCLWPVFATTLCHAFAFFSRRLALASIVGAVSGAGSYIAGTRLTEVDFGAALAGPLLLAALWALLFPTFALLASRLVTAHDR